MNLHQLCLDSLNTEVTQALVCGKRLSPSSIKDFIITFGALHLFVVSGAHLHLWNECLKIFKLPPLIRKTTLILLLCACDFSAPILRAFTQLEITSQKRLHIPKSMMSFLALLICSPMAYLKHEIFSLTLSFIFAKIIFVSSNRTKSQQMFIAALALPVFTGSLGIPHYSSLFIVPVFTALLVALMPLAFLSLFSNYLEYTAVEIWWNLEHALSFIHIFYNHPLKPKASFTPEGILTILTYGLILNLFTYTLGVLWNRKSFSLYYS